MIKRKLNYVVGFVRINFFLVFIFVLFNGYFCWCKYLRFYFIVRKYINKIEVNIMFVLICFC